MNPDNIDKYIAENYSGSFMNNTKWEKLISNLTVKLDVVYFDFKLINSDKIKSNSLSNPDMTPYFIEPTLYKEVEWIKFPNKYEEYISRNNLKAGKRTFEQNIKSIEKVIMDTGQFVFDLCEDSIKLYGYRK